MVEWKKLGEVSNILYGYPFESSLFTEDSNHMPLIRIRDIKPAKASTYYSGACIDEYRIKKGDILVGMDGEFNLGRWNDRDGLLNQRVLKLTGKKNCCIAGYLYHYMGPVFKKIEKSTAGGSVKHLSAKVINNIFIPVPSLEEQERIVGILDTFTASIDNIKAQIEQRRKQYEHYRNTLLTFSKDDDSVEWKTLEDIFELRNGYTPSKANSEFWTDGTIPWFRMEDIRDKGRILSDSYLHITESAIKGKGLFKANSFILATTATIGEHALLIADSLANQRFTNLKIRKSLINNIDIKFMFYYMFVVDEFCKSHTNVSGFASVDMNALKRMAIPIPSLARQQEIVSILDTFEASITNLEAQLEQRQKQYEYYREELLTNLS